MYRSLCLVLVLFAGLGSTSTIVDVLLPVVQCKEAQNISDELLRSIIVNNLGSEMNDPKAQCFTACLMDNLGILNPDGTVNTAGLINGLPQRIEDVDKVTEEFRTCGVQPGEGCEKKYKIALCIKRIEDRIASQTSD